MAISLNINLKETDIDPNAHFNPPVLIENDQYEQYDLSVVYLIPRAF